MECCIDAALGQGVDVSRYIYMDNLGYAQAYGLGGEQLQELVLAGILVGGRPDAAVAVRKDARVVALPGEHGPGLDGLDDIVVVAVRAELVRLLDARPAQQPVSGGASHGRVRGVLAEDLAALFAGQHDLGALEQLMVGSLGVALGAVEPAPAAGRPHGHLRGMSVAAGRQRGVVPER